jgi:hypothetical protein
MKFKASLGRFLEPTQGLFFATAEEALGWFFREAARMHDDYNLKGQVVCIRPDGSEVELASVLTGAWRADP